MVEDNDIYLKRYRHKLHASQQIGKGRVTQMVIDVETSAAKSLLSMGILFVSKLIDDVYLRIASHLATQFIHNPHSLLGSDRLVNHK